MSKFKRLFIITNLNVLESELTFDSVEVTGLVMATTKYKMNLILVADYNVLKTSY